MSTLIDRDLEVNRRGAHVARGGLSMRPVWVTGHQPARRRLTNEGELLERAGTCSAWADCAPERSRTKGPSQSALSQTMFLGRELDVATAVFGRLQLRRALETGRGPLVIDGSAVRFIDAAWLGVLVSTARYGAQLGRKVTVAAASPRVLRALHLVGLEWLVGEE
jgi:anti-sigma B factor antagonist